LDAEGRIVRFNRACERSTGYTFSEASGKHVWDLFIPPESSAGFKTNFEKMRAGQLQSDYECQWLVRDGTRRLIAWSGTSLGGRTPAYVIATGIDITERKHLEKAILDISEREQRRIGQDLHDGLGQHLTGIAFMTKVQEQKLKEKRLPYAADAAKIVKLVNQAIDKTRELARGLSPVVSESHGLMSALRQLGAEVEDVFGVTCHLRCEAPVLIEDVSLATHLYHISQEAVSNSVKHGKARTIEITLAANENRGVLTIQDDGSGCKKIPVNSKGMGHHIMTHRAKMIGGTLDIHSCTPHGTVVSCIFPLRGKE
jgi:PAS domain S-box-containing protein